MATKLLQVVDLTDRSREVVCDVSSLGPLLAGWWAELGLSGAAQRSWARQLREAVRTGNWAIAHRIAEHVSVSVTPIAVRGDASVWHPGDRWAV